MHQSLCFAATTGLCLLLLSGCQSSLPPTADDTASCAPAATASQEKSAHAEKVTIYANHFFRVGIPQGWQVLSTDGPDVPAFVTVSSQDHQALVTIRVSRSDLNTAELCQLAAKGFVANGADIVQGPEVSYGTCIIRSDDLGRPTTLWLRAYDDKTVYAINFTGAMNKVNEILGRLEGNEKMMQLLIMPL